MTARTLLACFLAAVLPSACVQTTYERFDATPAVAAEAPKVLWEKTFVGSAKSIAVLPDGGLAVAGYTTFKSAGRFDAWVLRLADRTRVELRRPLFRRHRRQLRRRLARYAVIA